MLELRDLENRTIYILREAYEEFKRVAVLWSTGKDSMTMLWLCRKAFLGKIPFPVIHIDTGYKFKQMYKFRDDSAKVWGLDLIIARNNIDRYIETGQIDMEYLKGLSYDAIPEMQRLIDIDLKNENIYGVKHEDIKDGILVFFNDKKLKLDTQEHWQSFNISRYRASGTVHKFLK